MRCNRCNQELRSLASVPGLNRIAYPHVCKQNAKLGDIVSPPGTGIDGVGPEWARTAYANYYATSPSVYAAVKLRAENSAIPPLKVYRTTADGERQEEPDHDLAKLLRKVNPYWTASDLKRATSIYLDLFGSAFWMLVKTGPDAPPTEIWPLRPDRMHIVPSKDEYIAGYWMDGANGKRVPLRRDEVIWFRYFNPMDEYAGLSPIAAARLSIDMGNEATRHNRNIFKNGMLWGSIGLIDKDGQFSDEQVNELYAGLKKRFAGPDNSWKPPVFRGLEPKNLGLTNRDLEFMASLRWSLEDVARVYSVPKPLIGDLTEATYSNIDAAERIFWRNGMVPHLQFIEDEINEMLVPMFKDERVSVAFDLSSIQALAPDEHAIVTQNLEMIKSGVKTINEVRAEMGLEPVAWGDAYWVPLGTSPVEDANPPMSAMPEGEPQPAAGILHTPTTRDIQPNGWKKWHAPALSDDNLTAALGLHDKALARGGNRLMALQRGLFEAQRREVLRNIREAKAVSAVTEKQEPFSPQALSLLDIAAWVRRFQREGAPLFAAILVDGARDQVSTYGLGVTFDPTKEGVQRWLEDRVGFWATRVNEETARLLTSEIAEGIENQEGIKAIQDRVKKVFNFSDVVRSEMIARTETQAAVNEGAQAAYEQSGVVERKMWLATLDARTRDTHLEAHRQVVDLHAQFVVGGEMLDHPGDGSPGESINCRCTIAPVIERSRMLHKPRLPVVEQT